MNERRATINAEFEIKFSNRSVSTFSVDRNITLPTYCTYIIRFIVETTRFDALLVRTTRSS